MIERLKIHNGMEKITIWTDRKQIRNVSQILGGIEKLSKTSWIKKNIFVHIELRKESLNDNIVYELLPHFHNNYILKK